MPDHTAAIDAIFSTYITLLNLIIDFSFLTGCNTADILDAIHDSIEHADYKLVFIEKVLGLTPKPKGILDLKSAIEHVTEHGGTVKARGRIGGDPDVTWKFCKMRSE